MPSEQHKQSIHLAFISDTILLEEQTDKGMIEVGSESGYE